MIDQTEALKPEPHSGVGASAEPPTGGASDLESSAEMLRAAAPCSRQRAGSMNDYDHIEKVLAEIPHSRRRASADFATVMLSPRVASCPGRQRRPRCRSCTGHSPRTVEAGDAWHAEIIGACGTRLTINFEEQDNT